MAEDKQRRLVGAQDIVRKFKISYATLNNYTDMGLLNVLARKNRMRMYDFDDVRGRLETITRMINEGYTLRVICKLLR